MPTTTLKLLNEATKLSKEAGYILGASKVLNRRALAIKQRLDKIQQELNHDKA